MLTRGTTPPAGVREECMALTAPLEAAVVNTDQSTLPMMPMRVSFPSISAPPKDGLPVSSAHRPTLSPTQSRPNMTR